MGNDAADLRRVQVVRIVAQVSPAPPGVPSRFDPAPGPSGKVALLVPGAGYLVTMPLLEFARQALVQHGWTVQAIWWEPPSDLTRAELPEWVNGQVQNALDAETDASEFFIAAKSLGTHAAETAAVRGVPAIWFTPLFAREETVAAIERNPAPQLLVGGLDDPQWHPARARATLAAARRAEAMEVAAADHLLCIGGDAVRTAEVHVDVARRVDRFLASLQTG